MLQCPRCGNDRITKDGNAWQRHAGGPDGKQRYRCAADLKRCKWRGTQPVGLIGAQNKGINSKLVDALLRRLKEAKCIIVTSGQNATPTHTPFFESLLRCRDDKKAELIAIPFRYKNPTSVWTDKDEGDDWWAEELQPYLCNRRVELNSHLVLLGDIMTQPTAASPLSGYETISGKQSAIIGHTKIELLSIPTPQASLPKLLTTTGACTVRNYVHAKVGKKAEHHHTFGAVMIELDEDGRFHMRQLNALDDGTFMDLDSEYRPNGIERGIRAEALNMGDTHEEFVSPAVVQGTFGEGGIVPTLKPKILVWHDLHDFYARNHHHRGDPFVTIAKQRSGMGNVEGGLRKTFSFLEKHTPPGTQSVVVDSNHPNAFARWIKEADWKYDPVNAEFYLKTALVMTQQTKMTSVGAQTIDPFTYWGKQWLGKTNERVRFLDPDESYVVKGIEFTYHGHKGANGAKGSIKAFGKIGVKTIIGHSHTPGIKDGVYQNGTSTPLKLEYTSGPSSWLNTHTVVYRNGKRSLINIIDGKWRSNMPLSSSKKTGKIS